jgi:hypothetical protein
MKFFVYGHQHKGEPYHQALIDAGWISSEDEAEVVFLDKDWYMHNDKLPHPDALKQHERGAAVMIYPHSAMPPWWYDGLMKIQPFVSCVFVVGEGQKEAMRIIEPDVRVETTGWPWCEQKPFQEPEKLKHVLFAPIHPAGTRLRPEAVQANCDIAKDLKRVARWTGCKVTVRYIGKLRHQGLKYYHRFDWIEGAPDGSTKEIDDADVVIAEGTFMYLSIARGKPTVGINQHLTCRANKTSEIYTPHHWNQYGPGIAYPINYQKRELMNLIEYAIEHEQAQWRADFIGDTLDPFTFAEKVKTILNEKQLNERQQ